MAYQANPGAIYPFLQFLMRGAQLGQGANAGANPFFNIYSPAPPGTSQTTAWPLTPTGPGAAQVPPIMPPPSSATIVPPQTAPGAAPIGQIPPAPAGAIAAGQGAQGIPNAAGAGNVPAINPAAVPPFTATTPPPPTSLMQPPQAPPTAVGGAPSGTSGQAPGTAGTTWMWQPGIGGGTFTDPNTGRAGIPQAGDQIQVSGGPVMSYSQFSSSYGTPGTWGVGSSGPQMGGGDRMGGGRF
jgi:hypothetical protein